jgi:hypothetical protein
MRSLFHTIMGSGGGGAFAPTDISGLRLWVDASDFVSAGAISQWNDKSGMNNHLVQATGANQPTVILNQQNNKAVVYFDSLKKMLPTSNIDSTTDFTMIFLSKKTAGTSRVIPLSSSTANYSMILNDDTNAYMSTPTHYQASNSSVTNTVYDVFIGTRTGNTMIMYKNNVIIASTQNAFARTSNSFNQFGSNADVFYSDANIAESLFYNKVLSTEERTDISTYLATKWAL